MRGISLLALVFTAIATLGANAQEKPNILVIFGDDVGITNISAYSSGKEFPPRSFPPSFVPTKIMEETLDDIRDVRRRAK